MGMAAILSRVKNLRKRKRGASGDVQKASGGKRRKRHNSHDESDEPALDSEDKKIAAFIEWCGEVGIVLHPKLSIRRKGSCADIGVIAVGDIRQGEQLALIPRTALLNCTNSSVHGVFEGDQHIQRQLSDMNSWVPLLLALMGEYAQKVKRKECLATQLHSFLFEYTPAREAFFPQSSSSWFPYLSLVPNNEGSGPPLLWSECERKRLLQGTGVEERVESDRTRIGDDFKTFVLPFMKRHTHVFKKTFHSQQLYEKLVSFVMSYSFTDSEEENVLQTTMMVPFVDLLNHHSNHHAELNFHEEHLELVAVRRIRRGEEVMNTYGPLPNAQLLHIYGFTEAENPHDVAYVGAEAIEEVYLRGKPKTRPWKEKRWKELESEDLIESVYEVSSSGEPEEALVALVKLLCGKAKDYQRIKDHLLGCSSDISTSEEEETVETDINAAFTLSKLKHKEVDLLRKLAKQCLDQFPESYESNLQTASSSSDYLLIPRERHALYLCIGQQNCLMKLLKCLDDS